MYSYAMMAMVCGKDLFTGFSVPFHLEVHEDSKYQWVTA